jgi:hypothetical protein
MTEHIFMPGISLQPGFLHPAYEEYLTTWREDAIRGADCGDVAASICHQATMIDLILFGTPRHDWLGIMDEFLTDEDMPLAYSEIFGKRLHKFANQYKQSTIHAIHTRWWIECANDEQAVDHERFANLVVAKRQSDGLIYDFDISETTIRHRMKSELTISMAMAAEILRAASMLAGDLSIELATNIVCPRKCPTLGYMSMEYFRLKALQLLGYDSLFPVGIENHIEDCAEDLRVGWCDFAMKSKVDAYMGTAKRTQRDKPIHSPLIACHVSCLLPKVQDAHKKTVFVQRMADYARYLRENPTDIPAFQMRDVPIAFGADRTPIEAICASHLINLSNDE